MDFAVMFQAISHPGPNSNTFVAFVARNIPRLELALPSNALGKDFLPDNKIFAKTPSCTGFQISFHGLLGIMLAKKEGIEVNLFGFVYGISPTQHAIKLPTLDDLKIY